MRVSRVLLLSMLALAGLLVLPSLTFAQYVRTDLFSNTGTAQHPAADPDLINAWGLVSNTTSPFWVSDNGTGRSTLYAVSGSPVPTAIKLGLVVRIPSETGVGQGSPTGIVANETAPASTDFTVTDPVTRRSGKARFIFATLDGTISGWSPTAGPNGNTASIAADRSAEGATYTGLAIGTIGGASFLYAADDGPNRRIDMFDSTFAFVKSFGDSAMPKDLTPYGIQNINGQLWVTYTPLNKAQDGAVDIFSLDGALLTHFALHGPLHSPWGVALAPGDFGPMSNAILITNNTPHGRINAFDPNTGAFLGPLRDETNQPIEIDDIWAIQFGQGASNGLPNQLFFTAGSNDYGDGSFGVITVGQ